MADIFGNELIKEQEEIVKKKTISPFDFARSLNEKDYIFEDEKDYNSYMVNKTLSFGIDTIFYANDINQLYFLDKKLQYDYLFNSIREAKRYNKWIKPTIDDRLNIIAAHYNYSLQKAKSALKVLTEEQINGIIKNQEKGGTKK